MSAIDFLLNVAGLLLWLTWRSMRFDPLIKRTPVTLIGTLKPAESRRLKGWQLALALICLLGLRAVLYKFIGAPANWTPKLNLELVVLAFRSDIFSTALAFSCLSFLRAMLVMYFWLLVLALINRAGAENDPIQKLVRLQLGRAARWPGSVQLLLPFLVALAAWLGVYPLLVDLSIVAPAQSTGHLVEQGFLVGLGLFLSLKYVLPVFLLMHLFTSYVYLGTSPLWDYASITAGNLTAPLRRLPLRFARLDLTPVAGVILILFVLQWLPNVILGRLSASNLSTWPL
jgi:uncharacterized protein YggT (Ycf19 family)